MLPTIASAHSRATTGSSSAGGTPQTRLKGPQSQRARKYGDIKGREATGLVYAAPRLSRLLIVNPWKSKLTLVFIRSDKGNVLSFTIRGITKVSYFISCKQRRGRRKGVSLRPVYLTVSLWILGLRADNPDVF